MKYMWLKIKTLMNGDLFSKITFLLTCFSVIIFTIFIVGSFLLCERPEYDSSGFVKPIVYSKAIIYFPCSGENFAKSLVKYLDDNEIEVCGMASKNKLWTNGYIISVRKKPLCPETLKEIQILIDGKQIKDFIKK